MTPSGKYFASVLVDTAIQELPASTIQGNTTLGIDLGIKSLAVCSDGRTFDNPKNLQRSLDRLKLLQKRLSRKQKGSANRNKARILISIYQFQSANSKPKKYQSKRRKSYNWRKKRTVHFSCRY